MGSLSIPVIGEAVTGSDPKIKTALETYNNSLDAENKIKAASLETGVGRIKWYTPKIIATEESRTNVAYGTLTTADEIASVVVPENGLLLVGYSALFKSSVGAAGNAAVFLNSNQLKRPDAAGPPVAQEATTVGAGTYSYLTSAYYGLGRVGTAESVVTTGMALGGTEVGGLCAVTAAAATYTVSVRFKASSGSITAKERKLWVVVLGV